MDDIRRMVSSMAKRAANNRDEARASAEQDEIRRAALLAYADAMDWTSDSLDEILTLTAKENAR